MAGGSRPYEMLDHTADLGIRVRGETLEVLFENAAFALFDNLADLPSVGEDHLEEIRVQGADLPELLVNYLNQLLFLWESRLLLFGRFRVDTLEIPHLRGRAWGEAYDAHRHELATDIKAATYHNLAIQKQGRLWTAEIILDT